eukprot:CAMPEP_0116549270 /NCGR_PEP_ID=MMETSP0397-20121206/4782_1 /TAXON_ID=216820 /ORGANISM="Cyclophora tenuis, Strain ECT3854" /LENGTH=148 /DNA_ID=CAMNT_0004073979 /DNA_START=286 /DNA_END=732 /DNA_ORIENTATION=+
MTPSANDSSSAPAAARTNPRRKKAIFHQTFHSYLTFGKFTTYIIGCFLVLYILVIVCLIPMLSAPSFPDHHHQGPLQGAHLPHAPSKKAIVESANKLRAQFQKLRRGTGITDENLFNEAVAQFGKLRAAKELLRNRKKNAETRTQEEQ